MYVISSMQLRNSLMIVTVVRIYDQLSYITYMVNFLWTIKSHSLYLGVNSIDLKNLGQGFGQVVRPKLRPILVLYFQFDILGKFSGKNSDKH